MHLLSGLRGLTHFRPWILDGELWGGSGKPGSIRLTVLAGICGMLELTIEPSPLPRCSYRIYSSIIYIQMKLLESARNSNLL